MTSIANNFYCSQKFTWLTVDFEKKLLYSCCNAYPENIDFAWLKANPGNLFVTANLRRERQDMLDNTPVSSCQKSCWAPESKGLESRRIQFKTYTKTHDDVDTREPEYLNVILGSTCNLACTYCCKQYSTAWTREIEKFGPYFDDSRFRLVPLDAELARISHNDHRNTEEFDILLNEISNYKKLKYFVVTGGEPFLYNGFPDLINSVTAETVYFYTGLGIDTTRLTKQLRRLKRNDNMSAIVSAENCDRRYEFNRFGHSYERFDTNLRLLQQHFPVQFQMVLSNLTIHGLVDFERKFSTQQKIYNFCNDPDYLAVNVLDDATKRDIIAKLAHSDIAIKDQITASMMVPCTESLRQQFASYLSQLSYRRNLELDIFPTSMLKWLNLL